jgi:hypothetical protein
VNKTLRRLVDRVEQLPPERQDAVTEMVERELEEAEWDLLLSSPASQRFLTRTAEEARKEHAAGLTVESDDDW